MRRRTKALPSFHECCGLTGHAAMLSSDNPISIWVPISFISGQPLKNSVTSWKCQSLHNKTQDSDLILSVCMTSIPKGCMYSDLFSFPKFLTISPFGISAVLRVKLSTFMLDTLPLSVLNSIAPERSIGPTLSFCSLVCMNFE